MFRRLLLYLILLSFLPLLFVGLPDAFVQNVRSFMNRMTTPVLGISSHFFGRVDDFFDSFFEFLNIQEENKNLKEEIGELRLELDRFRYQARENERLVRLLNLVQQSSWEVLPARVIGRSPSQWNQSVWIDRGKLDGLKVGMAVSNANGAVGKVVEIHPRRARILLLIDETCKVGSQVLETQEIGILQGNPSGAGCILNYLPQSAQAKTGDQVVSSGFSKFFPPSLKIGTIGRIQDDPYGLYQYAEVVPSVNFGQLQEVLVIMTDGRELKDSRTQER